MVVKANWILLLLFGIISCKKESPAPLPSADFYVANNECLSPCYLYFYSQSLNAVKYKWDFDNLTGSASEDDSSLYFSTGLYKVNLSVWNADDVADSVSKTVTVY